MRLGIGTATFFNVTYANSDPVPLIEAVAYAV